MFNALYKRPEAVLILLLMAGLWLLGEVTSIDDAPDDLHQGPEIQTVRQ